MSEHSGERGLPRIVHDLVYDVLVEECGAHEGQDARTSFEHHFPQCVEFRFQGRLGFGGKVWWNPSASYQPLYVNCYREDETPERLAMIERANARLAALSGSSEQVQS